MNADDTVYNDDDNVTDAVLGSDDDRVDDYDKSGQPYILHPSILFVVFIYAA